MKVKVTMYFPGLVFTAVIEDVPEELTSTPHGRIKLKNILEGNPSMVYVWPETETPNV